MLGLEAAKGWAADIASGWKEQGIPGYQVDSQKIKHLAIICDGNRRAALEVGFDPYLGHLAGLEVIKGIARAGRIWHVPTLTFWVWSTENWKRDKRQTDFVLDLAQEHLSGQDFLNELIESDVRFAHLGRKDRLPPTLQAIIAGLEQATACFQRHRLNLALDYGGRDEVSRVYRRMIRAGVDEGMLKDDPSTINHFLDTDEQPAVDLVIRTGVSSGELPHTSGFMPLQSADAAWIFLPDLFPNLTPEKLLHSIQRFEGYEKRLGR